MRNLILLIGMLFLTTICWAQEAANVSESKENMKLGTFNALTVSLPNASDKVALNVWKSYIKAYGGKAKKVKKSKEYLSQSAVLAGINNADPTDVYARVSETSNGSEMTVWFSMGEFYVSSAAFPSDYTAAQKFLQDYAHEVAKELVVIELENEEKKYKKMEKEMKKLKKKNDGFHKDIEKAKEAIAKAERNIEENVRQQKEQTNLMEEQQKAMT
ncbi:MAG: hypothetical protein AAF573_11650, partial [Bacteroidota bacterium]